MRTYFFATLALCLLASCGGPDPDNNSEVLPRVVAMESLQPMVTGTPIVVTATDLNPILGDPVLLVRSGGSVPIEIDPLSTSGAEFTYLATEELIDRLGSGVSDAVISLAYGSTEGPFFDATFNIGTSVPLRLDSVPSGDVHWNQLIVVNGDGFLAESEGTIEATFNGTYTPDSIGAPVPALGSLPVKLVERFSRTRAFVELSSSGLGTALPGVFEGIVQVDSRLENGSNSSSEPITTTLRFGEPAIYAVAPDEASLESIVEVRGAGFLGGPGEVTLVRAQGTFSPARGEPRSFGPEEFVFNYVNGETLAWTIDSMLVEDHLESRTFMSARGTFDGTFTPVAIRDGQEIPGFPAPIRFTITRQRQVVLLRFLPSFYASLPKFGLAASQGVIEQKVRERMSNIFGDWAIDIVMETPTNVSRNGYSTVEIGGVDPNGIGLFGYDNTPGKDINNVRLADAIGGANAETQDDGFPGYGGVFVESFLMFSRHPEIPVIGAGPDADPSFDLVFDPVRSDAATLAEVRGSGDPERVMIVETAISALSSIIGETAAHELGHSFGLADPYGSATTFHNSRDLPGCLMDSGGSRPFGERAALPGFQRTKLCGDNPVYLDQILSL